MNKEEIESIPDEKNSAKYKLITWDTFQELMDEETSAIKEGNEQEFLRLQAKHLKEYGPYYKDIGLMASMNQIMVLYSEYPSFYVIFEMVRPLMHEVYENLTETHLERLQDYVQWNTGRNSFIDSNQGLTLIDDLKQCEGDKRKEMQGLMEAFKRDYEVFLRSIIIPTLFGLTGRKLGRANGGYAMKLIKQYKKGLYAPLFEIIDPAVRHIISHADYLIDVENEKVISDRGELSHYELFVGNMNLLFLMVSMDIYSGILRQLAFREYISLMEEQGVIIESLLN